MALPVGPKKGMVLPDSPAMGGPMTPRACPVLPLLACDGFTPGVLGSGGTWLDPRASLPAHDVDGEGSLEPILATQELDGAGG